jgi:hypothetical protein
MVVGDVVRDVWLYEGEVRRGCMGLFDSHS